MKKRIPKRYAIEIINKMLTGFCPLVFRIGEQEPFLYTLKSDEKQFLNVSVKQGKETSATDTGWYCGG